MIMSSLSLVCILLASSAVADTYMRGYYKSNGSYVNSDYRSDKDNSFNNNWSTKGNYNPYTGKSGWKSPRIESSSRSNFTKSTNRNYEY